MNSVSYQNSNPDRSRVPLALAGMVGLVSLGLLVFFLNRGGDDPLPPPLELSLVDAIRKDGVFFAPNEEAPFTGLVVEQFDSGQLKSRTSVRNGLLHGVSEGWHANGQLQVQEYFREGVSHGKRSKWLDDGSRLSEGDIVDGAFNGTFRKWFPNGQLSQEILMKDGKADGLSRAWFENGSLKSRVTMEMGEIREQEFFDETEAPDATGISENSR